jgi:hypothetical protein
MLADCFIIRQISFYQLAVFLRKHRSNRVIITATDDGNQILLGRNLQREKGNKIEKENELNN